MRFLTATVAALLLVPVHAALASPELARKHLCMNCHAMDRKLIGPSYREIAARYAGQRDAEARMAEKIVRGGAGAWGAVPMPANPKVSADEARALAAWVLAAR